MPETSGAEALDAERESAAYNNSIYLMVGMPYTLLGVLGLLIYRGYRRQSKDFAQRIAATATAGGSSHVLSLPTNSADALPASRSDC